MFKLGSPDPYWLPEITLGTNAVRLQVRPISSAMRAVTRSEAYAGGLGADPSTEALLEASDRLTHAYARRAIVAWEGVGDDNDKPLEVTPERISQLLDASNEIFRAFEDGYVMPAMAALAEKNGSAALPNGTSGKAARATARRASPAAAPNAPTSSTRRRR